ncbi:putative PEP-CTERM system TPR-repeat lipoprotein [Phaeobacter sp. CECT 5382]|uniref:transcriptional regulator n=1 Tax=Rhodobacterales TaxID=204455 RepID=UPI0006DABD94|nr:transcriptional regulator [Phaeobacter sp. CECT 5382]CUH89067.1 putative PEP-CTERM system TPR-repeat lipoprotein [Phaeobacter sp. CECT 5382]
MCVLLRLGQFGAFSVASGDKKTISLGAKHQALLALLSTAESGVRTRAFLEQTLWSLAQPEQAKASLRTALSTLRRHLGPTAAQVLSANRERVILDLKQVAFEEPVQGTEFMEGFELPYEVNFARWLQTTRSEMARRQNARSPGPEHVKRQRMDSLLPLIAVLPFVQISPGEDTSALGSLISEELSRSLARSQAFTVTSYLASRQFDPARVRPAEVSAVAGVKYLVSGSVRATGQKMSAEIELHDAEREQVIWSRHFEGPLQDLMSGQCDALSKATQQIGQTLVGDAVRVAGFKPLSSLEGHTLLMAAISMMQEMTPDRFGRAREILTVLLDREPQHPLVLTWMGFWHVLRVQKGFSSDRQLDAQLASQLATSALSADPSFSLAHTLKGAISSHLLFHFDLAQESYDLALKDNPNEAMAILLKGATWAYQNRPIEAVKLTDAARRLTPLGPQRYYFDSVSAFANLSAHNYDRAIELADRSLQANSAYPASLRTKAIALQLTGRGGEAKEVVQNLMTASPDFNLGQYSREHPAAISQAGHAWTDALKQAGVPD